MNLDLYETILRNANLSEDEIQRMLEEKRLQQEKEIGKSQDFWKSQDLGGDFETGAENLLKKIPMPDINSDIISKAFKSLQGTAKNIGDFIPDIPKAAEALSSEFLGRFPETLTRAGQYLWEVKQSPLNPFGITGEGGLPFQTPETRSGSTGIELDIRRGKSIQDAYQALRNAYLKTWGSDEEKLALSPQREFRPSDSSIAAVENLATEGKAAKEWMDFSPLPEEYQTAAGRRLGEFAKKTGRMATDITLAVVLEQLGIPMTATFPAMAESDRWAEEGPEGAGRGLAEGALNIAALKQAGPLAKGATAQFGLGAAFNAALEAPGFLSDPSINSLMKIAENSLESGVQFSLFHMITSMFGGDRSKGAEAVERLDELRKYAEMQRRNKAELDKIPPIGLGEDLLTPPQKLEMNPEARTALDSGEPVSMGAYKINPQTGELEAFQKMTERYHKIMRRTMYNNDTPYTIVKEGIQNSVDSIRNLQDIRHGDISIDLDTAKHKISIKDTGLGMDPEEALTSMLDLGGSGNKPADSTGSLGLAKEALFGNSRNSIGPGDNPLSIVTRKYLENDTTTPDGKVIPAGHMVETEISGHSGMLMDSAPENFKPIIRDLGKVRRVPGGKENEFEMVPPTTGGRVQEKLVDVESLDPIKIRSGTDYSIELPVTDWYTSVSGSFGPFIAIRNYIEKAISTSSLPIEINADMKDVVQGGYKISSSQSKRLKNPGYEGARSYHDLEKLGTISKNWGEADIYINKGLSNRNYVYYDVLGNGLYQLEKCVFIEGSPKIPTSVVVDIRPGGRPEDIEYPFEINRENLRKTALEDIEGYLRGDMASAFAAKERHLYKFFFENSPAIPAKGSSRTDFRHLFLDPKNGLSPDLLEEMSKTKWAIDLTEALEGGHNLIRTAASKTQPKLSKGDWGGLFVGLDPVGMNVNTELVTGVIGSQRRIFFNPFAITEYVANLKALGYITREQISEMHSDATYATLTHEIAHNSGARDNSLEFSQSLTWALSESRRPATPFIDNMTRVWKSVLEDPTYRRHLDEYKDTYKAGKNVLEHVAAGAKLPKPPSGEPIFEIGAEQGPGLGEALQDRNRGIAKQHTTLDRIGKSDWPTVREQGPGIEIELEKAGVVFPESGRAQDTITKLERGELVRKSSLKGTKFTSRQKDWMKANTKDSVDNEFVYSPQPGTDPLVIANSAGDPKVFQDIYEVQNYIMEKKYNGQDHFNATATKYAAGARDQWGASYFDRVMEQAVRDPLYGDVITINPEARSGAIETHPLRDFAVNWSHPAAEILQSWAGKEGIGRSLIISAHDFTNEVNALRASHVARINQIVFGDVRHMWRVDLTKDQSLQVVRALLEGKPDKITDSKAIEKYNLVQGADGFLALLKQQFLDSDPVKDAESQSNRFNHADRLMSRLRRMVIKPKILKEMKLGRRSRAYENAAQLTASTRKMSIEDAYKTVDAWLDDIKALDPDLRRARNEKLEGEEVKAKASDVVIPDSYLNTDLPRILDQLSRGNSASLARLNNAGGWGAINKMVDEIPRSENIEATLVTFRKLVEQVPLQPDNLNLAEFPPLAKIQSFFISGGLSGRAPLTNLTGTTVNHLLAGDYRSLIEGMAKLHADQLSGKAAVAGGEFGGISPKPGSRFPIVNFIRSLHPFPISEKYVRRVGFEAGLARTEKLVSRALDGDLMAMNDLKRYTNDYQRVIADTLAIADGSEFGTGDILYKEIGLPKSVANVALNMSRESSLPMEPYMAPTAWVTSGTGRILSTFKRFGLRQWIFNYNMVAKDIGKAGEYYKENPELSDRYVARASLTMAKTVFGSTVGGLFTDTIWSAITNTLDNSLIHRGYEALTDDQKGKTKRLAGLWAETMMVAGFGGIVMDILNTVTGLGTRNYGLTNTILGFNVSRAQASVNFLKNFSRSAWDVVRYLGQGRAWSSARDATRTTYSYSRQVAPGLKVIEGVSGWTTKAGRGDLDPFNQAPESRFAGRIDRAIDADSAIDTLRKDMMEAADRGNANDVSQYGLQYKASISRALDQANADGDVEKIARLENMMLRADDVIWQRENWAFMPKEDMDVERKRTQGPEPWKWLKQYYEGVPGSER